MSYPRQRSVFSKFPNSYLLRSISDLYLLSLGANYIAKGPGVYGLRALSLRGLRGQFLDAPSPDNL